MSRAPHLLGLALLPVLLAGCGSSGDELRDDVAALTEAANARDADRVRALAEDLVVTVEEQAAAGELPADRAERLAALARSVRTSADVIDEELLEQRRLEAERERLEQERARLEAERKAAEEAAERGKDEGKDEGKGEDDGKDEERGEGKGEGKGKDDD